MTAGHTLNFENPVIAASTFNQVCINCHTSERGTPLTAANFLTAFVDENRQQMNNALALGVKLLETRYDITVQLLDPESTQDAAFVKKSTGGAADFAHDINGTLLTLDQQYKLRGAAFNLQMGYQDNAAFLHARTYTRRLIYDALDFLDDGVINQSVGMTALSAVGQTVLDADGNPAFRKGPNAFVINANSGPLAPATSASMTYIIGFDRTTGAWTPALRERP